MAVEADLLLPYWLRTVRIGIILTGLVVVALLALPFIPGHGQIPPVPYAAIVGAAALGGAVVARLPWRRLFASQAGIRMMYVWSVSDILLISAGVAVTGGGHSELFLVYSLTTMFFAGTYPPRSQVWLLALTFTSYLAAVGVSGWNITPASVVLRLAMLGLVALLASYLSRELLGQMRDHHQARSHSEQWAWLLAVVAKAARNMTLDRDSVLQVILSGVDQLGFEGSAVCTIAADGQSFNILRTHGLPDGLASGTYPITAGVTGLVVKRDATVILSNYAERPEAIAVLRDAGFQCVAACPMRIGGRLAAVLIGGSRQRREPTTQEIHALELLATQARLALENIGRFEEEQTTVQRLEELDRLKSEFLATVSHELRTPLTVIEGVGLTLEQMWGRIDSDTSRELLGGLNANAKTLDGVITSLLDFSRLESGHLEVHFGTLDLSGLLVGTVGRLRGLFGGRALETDVEPELEASADGVLVERVVENLLSNAAKHTPEGTVVTVSAHRDDEGLEVAVSDTGPGIPPHELAHLGERFFRGGDIATRSRGLGLGLALVRDVLELHGSTLEITSAVGEGSRFAFRLKPAEPQAARRVPAGAGLTTPPAEA